MAELSPLDTELLSQDLPELSQVTVESPVYAGGQGLIEYRAAGDRGDPAVLMLHGLGSSSAGYRAQFAGLSRDFRVLAWNAPGFGDSSQIGRDDVSVDDYADALEAFLQHSRIEAASCPGRKLVGKRYRAGLRQAISAAGGQSRSFGP